MDREYDYIIIGGGTAGLVVASRLSEDPNILVAVIEAGHNPSSSPLVTIPGNFGKTLGDHAFDWMLASVPQKNVDNRKIPLPRGKTLGGTSAINSMTWARPCKGDLDALEELWADEDRIIASQGQQISEEERWDWESWFRYYLKSEILHPPTSNISASDYSSTPEETKLDLKLYDPRFHPDPQHGGPMQLSYVPWLGPTHRPFFKSLELKLGLKPNQDNGSGCNTGSYTLPTSIYPNGQRCYSVSAYYTPHAASLGGGRRNLIVLLGTRATKLVVSEFGDGRSAVNGGTWFGRRSRDSVDGRSDDLIVSGVEVVYGEPGPDGGSNASTGMKTGLVRLKQGGEVILSAGAYMTPALLELSGIGDSRRLEELGIEPRIDLPGVGENLQDHLLVPTSYLLKDNTLETGDLLHSDSEFAKKELQEYKRTGKGQYASIHSAFSLLPSHLFLSPSEIARIQQSYESLYVANKIDSDGRDFHGGFSKQFRIQERWMGEKDHAMIEFMHVPEYCAFTAGRPEKNQRYYSILCLLMHSLSRGSVHITSSNPLAHPQIDPNFLSHDADLKMLVHAVQLAKSIALSQGTPLGDMTKGVGHPLPDDEVGLGEYVKKMVETAHHPIGTASMLPRSEGGVVDRSLKVYGVKNLRVVDASIIPLHFSAHPQATIYALGEKAAEIIKNKRGRTGVRAKL